MNMKKGLKKSVIVLLAAMMVVLTAVPAMAKAPYGPYLQKKMTVLTGRTSHLPFLWVNNKKVTYSISDKKIAEVQKNSSGVTIDPKKPGTATVKAVYKGKAYYSKVTVKSIPFSAEQVYADIGTWGNIYNDEEVDRLEVNYIPGTDGFQMRRTESDGTVKYKTRYLKENPGKEDFVVIWSRTTGRNNGYYYEGAFVQPTEKGRYDYQVEVRAFQVKDGKKIYTKWQIA